MADQEKETKETPARLARWFGISNRLELGLFIVLLLLAVFTRFYHLGDRVMSHDESLHTQYSYQLRQGDGFLPNPLMHGPLQFHLIATSFFVLGDSDMTARVPVALAGVAGVILVLAFRRWLGKVGAWLAALLMLASPFMLYYSRYVRNEGLIVPLTLLMFLAVFKYYETRESRWLYLFVGSLALHYTAKETAFLYTAALLLFLGVLFFINVWRSQWKRTELRWLIVAGVVIAAIGFSVMAISMYQELYVSPGYFEGGQVTQARITYSLPVWVGLGTGLVGLCLAVAGLVIEKGKQLRTNFPSFNLIVITTTMILPLFAALFQPDAMNYQDSQMVSITVITVGILIGVSTVLGLIWDWKRWLISAGIFYGLFLVLFSTFFTQTTGIVIGVVGSLGYWLQQHEVSRGSQPWYYYLLVQLPVYEFVALIGAAIAAGLGLNRWLRAENVEQENGIHEPNSTRSLHFPIIPFLAYWSTAAFVLFTFSGERMPWLTVHIALPLILMAGWGLGQIAKSINWKRLEAPGSWFIPILNFIITLSSLALLGRLLGTAAPFQGKELEQLTATNTFIALLAVAVISGWIFFRLVDGWPRGQILSLFVLTVAAMGYILTARAAGMASYVNYDQATEFLVYAHGGEGVKDALQQIEDISNDTTNGLAIQVAYDDDVAWPLNWYLRKFPNRYYYGGSLSRELIGYPVILVGDDYFADADAVLRDEYEVFDYIRMVWPMQEYYNLTPERITNALGSAEYRQALWDIWFDRDYSLYGQLIGQDFSPENWSPSDRMRLYVRRDIMAKMWEMGASPIEVEEFTYVDPYADLMTRLDPTIVLGGEGTGPGQFQQPRDIAVAEDGTLYVVDSGNHRIQHLETNGTVLDVWGTYGDINQLDAPGGTFNQPWGIAVDPHGDVYVADTWNHRIQVFSSDGEFITMFGTFDTPNTPLSYWGPRDVDVDADGNVYVVDTGNKRVVVFDDQLEFIGEFGIGGYSLGELDEPVGITIADDGTIYLADTWNGRIQVFEELEPGSYIAVREWAVDGWLGQSLDNKPYMDIHEGILCTTDPEGFRILCFNPEGEFLIGWDDAGNNSPQFGVLNGLAFDEQGGLWVTDSSNGRIYYFREIASHVIIDS
jgi:uncharacterized protein (TIGR03663 family)